MEKNGQPSGTARTAAAARAAHLIVDSPPHIFADTLAEQVLGERAEELLGYHRAHGDHPILASARAQAVCRSRYTESRLPGFGQYVLLGAGLDTYAHRCQTDVRVFEVDHPATQEEKKARLGDRPNLVYVPFDFERDGGTAGALTGALADAGLNLALPALVSWLGVTMYLTRPAIAQVLAEVARLAPGSELVADHMVPAELRDAAGQEFVAGVGAVSARQGEPFRTFLSPADFAGLLAEHGLSVVESLYQDQLLAPELWRRTDALRPSRLSCMTRAVR